MKPVKPEFSAALSLRSFKRQTYSTNQGVAFVAAEKHTD